MSIILDSLKNLLNTRQREGEYLQDWTKRFWTTKEILESHMRGPIILHKIVMHNPDFDTTDPKILHKCYETASETFLTYSYIENADQS
jgi:hypothetical protein